jgi:hypothetical protein
MLTIKFTDGELVQNVDWNSLPNNKVIRYMDYTIGNQTIRLMGYDYYLRLKRIAYGVNIKTSPLKDIILLGKNGEIYSRITINLWFGKCERKDNLLYHDLNFDERVDDKFWRVGEKLNNPDIFIRNN